LTAPTTTTTTVYNLDNGQNISDIFQHIIFRNAPDASWDGFVLQTSLAPWFLENVVMDDGHLALDQEERARLNNPQIHWPTGKNALIGRTMTLSRSTIMPFR
jgi:hypothetical protein